MKTEITVRVVSADEGYFIGRAIGFRGVWATGETAEEAADRVIEAWIAMYSEEVLHTSNPIGNNVVSSRATELNTSYQLAAIA